MSQIRDEPVQYDMSTLDRVKIPDVGNIHKVVTQISTILGDYPCNHAYAHDYGHQFLIYDATVWLTLPNVLTDIIISKPGALTGTTHDALRPRGKSKDVHHKRNLPEGSWQSAEAHLPTCCLPSPPEQPGPHGR